MNWLKGLGISVKVAALAFLAALAVMAAKRQRTIADKWKDKVIDIELGNVVKGVETAATASTQAKLHDANANEIRSKAETRITQMGDQDREISDILSAWSAD